MSAQGTLEIQRHKRFTGLNQVYKVLVDGEQVGTINNGSTESFTVTPGRHEVQLKIEFTQSPPLDVDVPPGGTVQLTCSPRANPFTALIYTIFLSKKYLRLDPAP